MEGSTANNATGGIGRGLDELLLIQRIAEGDRYSREFFVDEYLPVAIGAFKRLNIPEQEHDDLIQGFFARLAENNYHRLRSFDGNSALPTWLFRCAYNYAIDTYIRRQRSIEQQDELDLPATDPGIDETSWVSEMRELLNGMIGRVLNTQEARVISLHFYEGYTNTEIANQMDIQANNVGVIKARALQKLREHLGPGFALGGGF